MPRHVFLIATSEDCPHCTVFEKTHNKDNVITRTLERSDLIKVVPLKAKTRDGRSLAAAIQGMPHDIRNVIRYFPSFIMVHGADWEHGVRDSSSRSPLRAFVFNYTLPEFKQVDNPKAPSLENLRAWITECIRAFDEGNNQLGALADGEGAGGKSDCQLLQIVPRFGSVGGNRRR